ncbi:hypothetical protein J7E62_07640 [Variovorax paradoxus]|nr:hypothetical protein [Variovorax paradoxus]
MTPYTPAMGGEAEPLVWSFQVVRPLGAADFPAFEAPQLKVQEVVDRLKQIAREGRRGAADRPSIQS